MLDRKSHLDLTAMAILIVLCFSWGLQQVAIKVASQALPPFLQAGIRMLGATLLLLIWMRIRRIPVFERDGAGWWGLIAGLLFGGEFLLIFLGLQLTTASRAVIFLYLSPFVVALGTHLFIPGERLRLIQSIGLVCAFTGVLLIFGESLTLPDKTMLTGDLMLIVAAVMWGATTVVIKASSLNQLPPSKTLLYQLAVSTVLILTVAWLADEPAVGTLTPLVIGSLAFQTVWVTFITYLLWFWLVRHYPAGRLSAFTFLTPIFGVLAGYLLLDEELSGFLFVALACVGGGIYLVNRR